MGLTRTEEAGERVRLFTPAAGVRLAFADRRVVALDVEADRYVRLSRAISKPVGEAMAAPALAGPVAALASAGLLKAPASVSRNLYASHLGQNRLQANRIAGVIGACAWAARKLRKLRFCEVLSAVKLPRASARPASAMEAIVCGFLAARPLYPRDYECFFDALALRHYLARRGYAVSWVFGVRGAPFAAHCWLEFDGVVLNDDPDIVHAYRPIMVV